MSSIRDGAAARWWHVFCRIGSLPHSGKELNRRHQLDALRGIAVILVIVHHWTSWGHAYNLGNIGVQLFFVLSAALITGILLDIRRNVEERQISLHRGLATFFIRRATRIWPIMFSTIGLVWIAGDRFVPRDDIAWHALFASNLLFFQRGQFESSLAHFWTLAVEQQFYLFWPLVIIFLPRHWLETVIVMAILVAPLARLMLFQHGYINFAQYNVLPFANLDSLGTGALMALWMRLPASEAATRWRLGKIICLIASIGCLMALFGSAPANAVQTLHSVLFGGVVVAAYYGVNSIGGAILNSRILVALGTVSYGIYVYHVFAPRAVGLGLRTIGAPLDWQAGIALFILSLLLTVSVAAFSWIFIERPMLTLGHRSR